jgi:hypothetical protein
LLTVGLACLQLWPPYLAHVFFVVCTYDDIYIFWASLNSSNTMAPTRRRQTKKRKTRKSQSRSMNPPRIANVGVVINGISPVLQFPEHFYTVSDWPTNVKPTGPTNHVFTFPGNVEILYTIGKLLGEGSFGRVSIVHPASEQDASWPSYALKEFTRAGKDVKDEIALTLNRNFREVMVPAKVIGKNVLMQLGVEIGQAHLDRNDNYAAVADNVAKAVFELQKKLIDRGYIYTDMKEGNVLAMPVPGRPNQTRVVLADYGGLCKINQKDCVYTYMVPERARKWNFGFDKKIDALNAAKWWSGLVGLQISNIKNVRYVTRPPKRHGMGSNTHAKWGKNMDGYLDNIQRRAGFNEVARYLRPNPFDRKTPLQRPDGRQR